ncbi:hypothetical protein GCM10010112_92470 [Actinoplanes lobatus]|uniref:DUF4291 domain-containing protein n=1 Tax=Actinoplanes lobatus TaxID=113568 RepID=A0A7W7MIQ7_9ACTN|nr:DUF4291 domain-containing protein [Actinoplanes lobatus]MBB4751817.1 hypothetical protein [Actinoplanes lobatus]GGN99039.1 hypothetical protein GCM10010112_92470 [Actinoplanes lobatus]GIE46261.1 hypothetical protein Alo02nite_91590 [Actinoplanes lobatus]
MPLLRRIRADFDADTIVMYQAFGPAITDAALAAGRFVAPFSFTRMTWIKPSLLWLMHRSNWARKPGQERVLAVRITSAGWEQALSQAVLTAPVPAIHGSAAAWSTAFDAASVHVQWDPERSARGAALNHYSIQVGIGRALIRAYAEQWVVGLTDLTPTVHKIDALIRAGQAAKAQRLLPPERPYPLDPATARRIQADTA